MIRLMLIGFFSTMIIGILSYQVAYSSFHSSATSQNNIFSTSSDFGNEEVPVGTPSATPTLIPGKIIINEVSPLGDTNLEWVELHNSGGTAVDISGWSVTDNLPSTDTFLTIAPIQPGAYAIIVTNDSIVTVPPSATKIVVPSLTIGNGLSNSGDALTLKNGAVTIDEMHYGVSTWPNTPTSGTVSRVPNGVDTDTGADWTTNTSSTIGVSN